jgi:hypothetical protein
VAHVTRHIKSGPVRRAVPAWRFQSQKNRALAGAA